MRLLTTSVSVTRTTVNAIPFFVNIYIFFVF